MKAVAKGFTCCALNAQWQAVLIVCLLVGSAAAAEWKPSRPIEIISGVAAGGSLDLAARAVQRILQEKRNIGQPISELVFSSVLLRLILLRRGVAALD